MPFSSPVNRASSVPYLPLMFIFISMYIISTVRKPCTAKNKHDKQQCMHILLKAVFSDNSRFCILMCKKMVNIVYTEHILCSKHLLPVKIEI